ncbi:hypothetical protein ACFWWU_36570 [Streptomyces sp. NPDC058650]|uniref:hypothetical protein n=1 Tax=Streptomyces sp. NPDC058650 TaxID=3346575 RepID=UPI003655F529
MKFTTEDAARHAAAVRAGIRTAAQAARGAGVAIVGIIGTTIIGVDWLVVAGVGAASVITVVWSGLDAYLGIIANGVPEAYQDAALAEQQFRTTDERQTAIDDAVERAGRHAA